MSEETNNKPQDDPKDVKKKEKPTDDPQTVDVNVDVKGMTEMLEQLKEERMQRKKLEADLKAAMEEKTTLEKKSGLTEGELEKYKSQLELIAAKEFEKKRAIILEKAKGIIKDEERLKIISEKITTPEELQRTEFMLETLAGALQKGKEAQDVLEKQDLEKQKNDAEKKVTPTGPAGSVPLTPAQVQGGEADEGYESYDAMIRDLRKQERSDDPLVRARAKSILNELFKKWVNAVKGQYKQQMSMEYDIEKEDKKTAKKAEAELEQTRTTIRDITKKQRTET